MKPPCSADIPRPFICPKCRVRKSPSRPEMMYTKFFGSAHSLSSASRVGSEGTAILGVFTIGVKVPWRRRKENMRTLPSLSPSGTHIVIEEEQPLLCFEVPVFQSVLLHEWCLPGHDVFVTHLFQEHLGQSRGPRVTSVEIHDFVHLIVPLSLLLWTHREATVDRSGDIAKTPRVDLEGLRHVV